MLFATHTQAAKGQPIELICQAAWKINTRPKNRTGLEIVLEDHGVSAGPREALRARSLDDIKPGGLGIISLRTPLM